MKPVEREHIAAQFGRKTTAAGHTNDSGYRQAGRFVTEALLVVMAGLTILALGATTDGAPLVYFGSTLQPTEAADLTGQVIDSHTGNGVSEATVTATGSGQTRRVVTADASGHFAFAQLPQGRYELTANHQDYDGGVYGQLWPEAESRRFYLSTGAPRQRVTIRLVARAELSGTLRTTDGAPLPNAIVQLIPQSDSPIPRPTKVFTSVTGPDGTYRIERIPPGKYVVGTIQSYQTQCNSTTLPASCVVSAREHSLSPVKLPDGVTKVYESTFYPAANVVSEAEVIQLRSGDNRVGVDLTVPSVAGVRIRGTVYSANGPLSNILIRATRTGNAPLSRAISLADASASTNKEGRFLFLGVPAGDYSLQAEYRARYEVGPVITVDSTGGSVRSGTVIGRPLSDSEPLLVASAGLSVGSVDISDVALNLVRGPFLKGAVRFTGRQDEPNGRDLSSRSAVVRPIDQQAPSARAPIGTNGEFYFPSLVPGQYELSTDTFPGWSIESVEEFGRSLGGRPLDLRYQSLEQVVVRFTDRAESIDGTVVDATGRREPNAFVFVFPTSAVGGRRYSAEGSMIVNASDEGRFTVGPLKPGDYAVIAVGDGWFDMNWQEREVLSRLSKVATHVRVGQHQASGLVLRAYAVD